MTGAWRVYARFVMVVMLAVSVLAAIGLHRLVRGRTLLVQALVLIVVSVVVVLDLRVRPVGTNTLVIPPIYEQLKKLPDGLVVEYPLEAAGHGDYSAEFFQDFHGKPILNGFDSETLSEFRALRLDKLSRPVTPGRLRMVGVRYVVLTHVPVEGGVTRPGRPGKGLRLIMDGKYASLYSVRGEAAAARDPRPRLQPAGADARRHHSMAEQRRGRDGAEGPVLTVRRHARRRSRPASRSRARSRCVAPTAVRSACAGSESARASSPSRCASIGGCS